MSIREILGYLVAHISLIPLENAQKVNKKQIDQAHAAILSHIEKVVEGMKKEDKLTDPECVEEFNHAYNLALTELVRKLKEEETT